MPFGVAQARYTPNPKIGLKVPLGCPIRLVSTPAAFRSVNPPEKFSEKRLKLLAGTPITGLNANIMGAWGCPAHESLAQANIDFGHTENYSWLLQLTATSLPLMLSAT